MSSSKVSCLMNLYGFVNQITLNNLKYKGVNMCKKPLFFTVVLCCCVGGMLLSQTNRLVIGNPRVESSSINNLKSDETSHTSSDDVCLDEESDQYCRYINIPATEQMPALCFEVTGRVKKIANDVDQYFPVKLVIKTDDSIIQEFNFKEDDFAPCTLDTFDFEYGDFKFNGYGGFKMLSTSMGKNPSYYFWMWDENKSCFIEYPDLEMVGYISFDYSNQEINISNTGGGDLHEFLKYKYVNNKLTLIEKIIDADQDGYRKIYMLIDGELILAETTESRIK